jgi:hypothetical protein
MIIMACGVARKCRSEPAAAGRRSRFRVVACQQVAIGVTGVGTTTSSWRWIWRAARCSTAMAPRYQPLVGGMAAAVPYCDEVVSAHRIDALDALIDVIAGSPAVGRRRR